MLGEFLYLRPRSLPDALAMARTTPGSLYLAGGTDALVRIKAGLASPSALIDLSSVPGLTGISLAEDVITVAALTTHSELHNSNLIRDHGTALGQAANSVGSPQIRNTGTLGGNVANASPAADTVTALVALGASALVSSEQGVREILVEKLFLGAKKTVLQDSDIIVGIKFNAHKEGQSSVFQKVGRRKALAISVVNAAVWLETEPVSHRIVKARIALGAVAPTVVRIRQAEKAVEGQLLFPSLIETVGHIVSSSIQPIDDIRSTSQYRKAVAGELVCRGLVDAWKKANSREGA